MQMVYDVPRRSRCESRWIILFDRPAMLFARFIAAGRMLSLNYSRRRAGLSRYWVFRGCGCG